MLVSLKWLDTMVKVPDGLQDFCDRLDLTGTGVTGIFGISCGFSR